MKKSLYNTQNQIDACNKIFKCIDTSKTIRHLESCSRLIDNYEIVYGSPTRLLRGALEDAKEKICKNGL